MIKLFGVNDTIFNSNGDKVIIPLIDQLNALELALSKNGQTNISQVNNDLPFKITASALKEWSDENE